MSEVDASPALEPMSEQSTPEGSMVVVDPRRLPFPIGAIAATYFVSRAAVLLVAQAVTWLRPDYSVTHLLSSWDGGWYVRIAEHGYPDNLQPENGFGNRWAFYPGLPWGVRGMSEVTALSTQVSGIILSV